MLGPRKCSAEWSGTHGRHHGNPRTPVRAVLSADPGATRIDRGRDPRRGTSAAPFRGQVPWSFNVIEGVERIAAYGKRALDHARAHRPDGPGWDWVERPGFDVFWGAPDVIVISGPAGDCNRAGQNLMLSAHARGLGTCWVGSPMLWITTPEVRSELKIPSNLTPVAVFCLGYPAEASEPAVREKPPLIWS